MRPLMLYIFTSIALVLAASLGPAILGRRASDIMSNIKSAGEMIGKRAEWEYVGVNYRAGVAVATVAAWGYVAANACQFQPPSICIGTILIGLLVNVINNIRVTGRTTGSFAENTRREDRHAKQVENRENEIRREAVNGIGYPVLTGRTKLGNYDIHYNKTRYNELGVVIGELDTLGVKVNGIGRIKIKHTSAKRGVDGLADLPIIDFSTEEYGNHSAISLVGGSEHELIDKIKSHRTKGSSLNKRSSTPTWVSYTYDYANIDWASEWFDNEQNFENGDAVAAGLDNFWNSYHPDKFCMAPQDEYVINGENVYDQIGKKDAMKGEVYFDQYGGIDNQCNDSKDGADM